MGKNGLHIRIQLKKSSQNDELFFLGFENINAGQCNYCSESFAENELVYANSAIGIIIK